MKLIQQVCPLECFEDTLYAVSDLSSLDESDRDLVLTRELKIFALKHLPLDKQLFAFNIFNITPFTVVLAINIHHIIYDGISMLILLRDLLHNINHTPSLHTLSLEQQLAGQVKNVEGSEELVKKWEEVLFGVKHTLRFSNPGDMTSLDSEHNYLTLPIPVQKAIQRVSRRLCVPVTAVLNTVLCIAMGILAGEDDFLIGLLSMNRQEDQRDMIGYYAKTLPLRVNFSSSLMFSSLVQSILKNSAMIYDSQLQLTDIVHLVPCLQHKLGESSPLHVLLSVYHFNSQDFIPSSIFIKETEVSVNYSHSFQAHFQTDIFLEILPQGSFGSNTIIHYEYRKAYFNDHLIHILHNTITQFILKLADIGDVYVHTDIFPRLRMLYLWRTGILPGFSLSLPSNIASIKHEPSCSSHTTVSINNEQLSSIIKSISMVTGSDCLLMTAIAYIMCCYGNQEDIGLLIATNNCIYPLNITKPHGLINDVLRDVVKSFEVCTNMAITCEEFDVILPLYQIKKYLCVCINTKATQYMLDIGVCIQYYQQHNDVMVSITAGIEFDQELLDILSKSFTCFINNLSHSDLQSCCIEDVPYWTQSIENNTQAQHTNIPLDKLYITQVEDQSLQRTPNAISLVHSNNHMTYKFMFQQVVAIATYLIDQGIKPASNIAIYMNRTSWLYITILAVLKTGCVYVPIALQNPPDRINMILEHTDIEVVMTESNLLENLETYHSRVICIDALSLPSSDNRTLVNPSNLTMDSLSCILYTSGTTGTPKGVALCNRNIIHSLNNILHLTSHDDTAITLASTNIVFDAHIVDALAPLLRGSSLIVVDNVSRMMSGITHGFATPSAVCCIEIPPSMRVLIVGGEAFTNTCFRKTKHVSKVFNIYGPTECTVFVTCRDEYIPSDPSNLGLAIPGATLNVTNPSGNIVPPGFPGILHIEGPQVGLGYYKDEEKSSSTFIPSCFDGVSCHMYCTGDWVRRLPNESLQFIGRADHQVKLRGQRFDLLEVENAILDSQQVENVCVFVFNQNTPSAILVACVTPLTISINSLAAYLKRRLPLYMIPTLILPLKEMPLNRVGKIDRVLLHALAEEKTTPPVDREEKGKEGEVIRKIANVFAGVLGVKSFPVNGDFFTNGGHSLLVVPLITLLNQRLGSNINTSDVLQYSTPLDLLDVIQTSSNKDYHLNTSSCLVPLEDMNSTEEHNSTNGSSIRSVHNPLLDMNTTEEHTEMFSLAVTGQYDRKDIVNAFTTHCNVENIPVETCNKPISIEGEIKSGCIQMRFNSVINTPNISINITNRDDVQSSINYYYQTVEPLVSLVHLVLHPKSFVDFGFLDPIPPVSFSKDFEDDIVSGRFEHASVLLLNEAGINIPSQSLKGCSSIQGGSSFINVITQQCKVKSYLSIQPENPVVVLHKPCNSENPLFFIHGGIIGWSLPYTKISKRMDYHSIGIQRTINTPITSFIDMALHFMNIIIGVQPTGPYSLFGVCYGACLAYEIAHQLVINGREVKLLAMINNSPVQELRPPMFDLYGAPLPMTSLDPLVFYEAMLSVTFPHQYLITLPDKPYLDCTIQALLTAYPWLPFTYEELKSLYLSFYHPMSCHWKYNPKPSNIEKCILIRNKTHPFFNSDDYGLGKLVKNLEVFITERKLGFLSEDDTMECVLSIIKPFLH